MKIIECPRDAMQGIKSFIPTDLKVSYINKLLEVGFDTIDVGSFVSPKAIPQMKDTAEVLSRIQLENTVSKLLSIVVNERGAKDASKFDCISYFGYPFSISETFQLRNTNATIKESLERLKRIHDICLQSNKELVVYISMGFGNPYGDEWNVDICMKWVSRLNEIGVNILALSDTIGVATPESITYLFSQLVPEYPNIEFGAHLHTSYIDWYEKVDAAFKSGCRRFDGAIKGYGGCPMAKDDLVGNMPTEKLIEYIVENNIENSLNQKAFFEAEAMSGQVFNSWAK